MSFPIPKPPRGRGVRSGEYPLTRITNGPHDENRLRVKFRPRIEIPCGPLTDLFVGSGQWHAFRDDRDDRAWKWLTDAIRAHAASQGRHVLISANGLARYVDLQALGVWENWKTTKGRVDLSENQIEQWSSTVVAGVGLEGRKVPVVLFHDWGFEGFPWMEISPDDRRLWIRVRGAEIYVAGGFFAFPMQGPFGNNARRDGTLAEVARQRAFYHRHEDLNRNAEVYPYRQRVSESG